VRSSKKCIRVEVKAKTVKGFGEEVTVGDVR